MKRKRLAKWCGVVFILGFANFTAFWIGAWLVGGDAWQGKIDDGRYFVGDHGKLTEVSRFKYRYSQTHILTVIVTQPLAIAAAILAGYLENRERKEAAAEDA